jgi:hypothetical protein
MAWCFWGKNLWPQEFCGEGEWPRAIMFDTSELTRFRKCICMAGMEKVLAKTIEFHGERAVEIAVLVVISVQEKNITFPTETKLVAKTMRGCVKMAQRYGMELRQSFELTMPKLLIVQRRRQNNEDAAWVPLGGASFEDDRQLTGVKVGCGGCAGKRARALGRF